MTTVLNVELKLTKEEKEKIVNECLDILNERLIKELEEIKADFVEQRKDFGLTKNDSDYDLGSFDSYNYAITTIDYRIAELKGENNA